MTQIGALVFFCGKMAAGKSTKALAFSREHQAVLLSEDEWLNTLYPDQIKSVQDYLQCSDLLKSALQAHVQRVLQCGVDVVMDFPGNTLQQRAWLVELARAAGAQHRMFYLQRTDEQCLAQLEQRRQEKPERAMFDTDENYHLISRFFEPPVQREGLNVELLSS